MLLKQVSLYHFRNFPKATYEFSPHLTIILGENARGKTNILESVYFTIHGEGFRESREDELVEWNNTQGSVLSTWSDNDQDYVFEIFLQVKGDTTEKKYSVQKTQKNHFQYSEFQTRAVLFAPEHIDIVSGAPDKRREYFNKLISLFDKEYKRKLVNYEHALRKRNKILEFHKNQATLQEELEFWDTYLEEQSKYLTSAREKYVDYLNAHQRVHDRDFEMEYVKNEFTKNRLVHFREEERKWRKTLIGPQKDDFIIHQIENGVKENIHLFGSRSEQRLGVFWLKLNEINYLEQALKRKPILLLDDVFSELDVKNKKLILDLVKQYQTIITTTELELLDLIDVQKTIIRL